ncbi:MAG: DUF1801 domain-containing protein [Pseudomonadota bacterium]
MTGKPTLLSGGNPQIPKGEGDAPVQAYIEAVPGWKQDVVRRVDAIIGETVPDVRKAVKWNSPLYGIEGQGVFLSYHCFDNYLKVCFHNGGALDPPPPETSKYQHIRYLHIREGDAIGAQFRDWVTQASRLPGEKL